MRIRTDHIIRYALIAAGAISLAWWVMRDPVASLVMRVPGMDERGKGFASEEVVVIGEHFESFAEPASVLRESWPRFRGRDFDNISKSSVRLIERFEGGTPEIVWRVETGEGHGGAAIYEGVVYIIDYDEDIRADMLRSFSLEDGRELWRRWYKVNVKRNHGMSRTIPAVSENYILTIGPRTHIMCVERASGDLLWGIDVEKEYETEIPLWYTGQCPLIYNEKAIIATGGKALMVAVDCATGEIVWETPNTHDWKMSHSSVMLYEFGGRKMFVYSATGGVCGIAADGSDEGRVLWEFTGWNHKVIAPSPVCMPDGKILLTAGYGAGGMMIRLTEQGGSYRVEPLQEYPPRDGLASEQQTPLYHLGKLFTIQPKDAGALRNQLVCYDPSDVTKVVWSSGPAARFGLGPYIVADNKMFVLSDDGTLTIVKPDTKSFIQLDQVRLFDGIDAWGPFAVADGYMVLRDSRNILCLNLRAD